MKVSTNIAGYMYREGAATRIAQAAKGEVLQLQREPENPYDMNAVAVVLDGFKLGYIPRVYSPMIAKVIQQGHDPVAFFNKTGVPSITIQWETQEWLK